jgi:hypothetical protein
MPASTEKVERVQLGVRMEKQMVKVLKGLAEFEGVTLGELLEKIVLHSFEPVLGDEGESCASPHGKAALQAITDLKRVYGMNYDAHSWRPFERDADGGEDEAGLSSPRRKGAAVTARP